MAYSEGDKMLLASFIMMDVMALQSENEIRKADGREPKYGASDFYEAVQVAERKLEKY